jgi:2-polyprenyl-3-methyl-5-hydroxy-6-metoxy-1,4-benzoquinol methylase
MAKTVYDDYYKEKEYFGAPYKGLVKFFEEYKPKGTVLDLGCGQGRDAIPIAKMGYNVIAVDYSKVGINQLKKKALSAGITINAIVDDVYKMNIDKNIDIVLLDSMLHFYKKDVEKESVFVNKILNELRIGGIFANFIIKGKAREKILKDIIDKSEYEWEILTEKYVDYPESASKYHMLVIRKVKNQ